MAQFLARHSYSGRKPPRELLGRLHSAAQGRAATLDTEACPQIVLALVAALEPILAKIAQLTSEIRGEQALCADGGQSPVAVESGKSKRARFRSACDHRLRNATGTLADSSRHHNPWARRTKYELRRAEEQGHLQGERRRYSGAT
ncbi:MAG: transposase [Solirubrobacteraceae bacterium]